MMSAMRFVLAVAAVAGIGAEAQRAVAAQVVSAAQTTAAVQLVAKSYVPNPLAKVAGSKDGLPKNGSWGARAAKADELTGACGETGAVCVAVLYHAASPEITCRWTVDFGPGDSVGRVVSDATATYMLRAFAVGDPEAPRLVSGHAPDFPPLARAVHLAGKVRILLYVDPGGSVQGASVQEATSPMFSQYVVDGTAGWKLEPTVLDGRRVWAQVAVETVYKDSDSLISIKRVK